MKTKSCSKMLGNGLMNDAWLGQTVDPSETEQTSLNISGGWRRTDLSCLFQASPAGYAA